MVMGYVRRILQADLSRDRLDSETLDNGFSRKHRSRGLLRACCFFKFTPHPINLLTPEYMFVFAPCLATGAPIVGQFQIAAEEALLKVKAAKEEGTLPERIRELMVGGPTTVQELQDEKGGVEEKAEEEKAPWLVL